MHSAFVERTLSRIIKAYRAVLDAGTSRDKFEFLLQPTIFCNILLLDFKNDSSEKTNFVLHAAYDSFVQAMICGYNSIGHVITTEQGRNIMDHILLDKKDDNLELLKYFNQAAVYIDDYITDALMHFTLVL